MREPRRTRERAVEVLCREPRDDQVDPRLHVVRIGLDGRVEQRDFLVAVAARQPQRDREVVAQRRPARIERIGGAIRRDGVGVTAEHLQHVAVIETGTGARMHAHRAFGQRERVGRALSRDERRRELRERGHVDRVQMAGGGKPQRVRIVLAARVRVGGLPEHGEQRRDQRNEEVVRIVHAVRSGQSVTRHASRAPQYVHLNARAKRCGRRRDTRIATPHKRPRRARRHPLHPLRTGRRNTADGPFVGVPAASGRRSGKITRFSTLTSRAAARADPPGSARSAVRNGAPAPRRLFMLTFQQIILTLQSYWDKQGCALLQPIDMEVGAGTSHVHTFLRAVGPEPWRAAYVQPSRRPKDGRYGENPNRLQHYYQYQVVLKPAPENILDLYLGSLEALGFDLKQNDVRFVEDDWENPTLGAWGLGWEVWLNGMEVTQFTYFQEVGGLECKPVLGEITYGLERLAMYLQKVENVYDLVWTEWEEQGPSGPELRRLSYGDVYHQNEVEQSTYNFEHANVDLLFTFFNSYEAEAKKMIDAQLALPAYELVLKAGHTFNLLDARGAISVTERAAYIGRIRALSRLVAQAYYDSREKLGFPMLGNPPGVPGLTTDAQDAAQPAWAPPLKVERKIDQD